MCALVRGYLPRLTRKLALERARVSQVRASTLVMWSDEEIVFFIRDYGSKKWVMYSLMALLGFLLLLNYKMWRRLQRTRTENEVHVEWTDAEDELEVRLSLPAAVTASDIRVEVQPASLKVFMKMGAKRKWEAKPLMEVELATPPRPAPQPRRSTDPPLLPSPSARADHFACSRALSGQTLQTDQE